MTHEKPDQDISPFPDVTAADIPAGIDRRTFVMRTAVITAATVMTGCNRSKAEVAVSVTLC